MAIFARGTVHKSVTELKLITMRKLFVTVLSFVLLFAVTACNRTPLERFEAIVEDVEANYESYTPEDWDAIEERLQAIDDDLEQSELTEEELREMGRLNGRLAACATKAAMKQLGSAFGDMAAGLGGFVEGLGIEIGGSGSSTKESKEAARRKGKELGEELGRFATQLGAGIEGFASSFEDEMEGLEDEMEEFTKEFEKEFDKLEDAIESLD